MIGRSTARGLFRLKGEPNLVEVQLGPFARPIPEADYVASGYLPPLKELPWAGGDQAAPVVPPSPPTERQEMMALISETAKARDLHKAEIALRQAVAEV
jgi:hypothetical protein